MMKTYYEAKIGKLSATIALQVTEIEHLKAALERAQAMVDALYEECGRLGAALRDLESSGR